MLSEEQPTIDFAYASVVAIRNISSGEKLTEENIWVKRPGNGPILAPQYNDVLGRIATRDIPSETQIQPSDIEK